MKTKAKFFKIRQNNSGGKFKAPAVHVVIEAANVDDACELANRHFTMCGDSGLYAEFDNCGCCTCCGHRWTRPWSDKPDNATEVLDDVKRNGLTYMGMTSTALITASGDIIIADTSEKLQTICNYLLQKC